jgi:hypothetical protein
MARAFILSHGERVPGGGTTFVPEGRTISFYSDYDENTERAIGLAAISAGDIKPAETFEAGDELSNYRLDAFADDEMAEHLAAQSSATGGRLYFVGRDLPTPTRLCTTPDACERTKPHHSRSCRGALRAIAEDEILSVSCRGKAGDDSPSTRTMEGSTDFMDELQTESDRILVWARTDPDAAMAYWQSLSEATKVMLTGADVELDDYVKKYFGDGGAESPAAVIEARNFLETHGDIALVDYVEQFDAKQRSMVLDEQDLLEAYWLGYGRRLLRNDGAPAFWDFYRTLDQDWMNLLAADAELFDALGAGSQGANVAETSDWAPTADDYDAATSINEPFVKDLDEEVDAVWEVGGSVVLLGEPSNELASRVRQQPDYTSGTFQVERARFGAGSLLFSGVPPVLQDTVTWAVGQFSKKDVKFE